MSNGIKPSLTTATLAVGQALRVRFEGTDGEFEIHFDSIQHPNSLVVKETAGLLGNLIGQANEVLYHEQFGLMSDDDMEAELDGVTEKVEGPAFSFSDIEPQFRGLIQQDESAIYLIALGNVMVRKDLPMSEAALQYEALQDLMMQNGIDGERARYILSVGPQSPL